MGMGGQRHAPAALPRNETLYPMYGWLGGPQGRSGRVRKIQLPPALDIRNVHPVASRDTDWAIPAHDNPLSQQKNENINEDIPHFRRLHLIPHNAIHYTKRTYERTPISKKLHKGVLSP